MAKGKLIADEIEHSSVGSLNTQFVVRGSAKAWANCTNAAVLNESFNCTTGTDHGTGDYSVTLTNAFSGIRYVTTAIARGNGAGFIVTRNPARDETTALAIEIDNDASTQSDSAFEVIGHGDLA